MATDKRKFLTKEAELELGGLIQASYAAQEELSSGKRLSPKKRDALNAAVKIGEDALDKLVRANMGLVYDRARIFKSRYPGGPEFEDLVQEGMAGLMVAARKYDPERGNKFSTVAYYWIAQQVARGANKTGRLVRLPENRINDYIKMNNILSRHEGEGLTSSEEDAIILEELGLSKADLSNIRAAASTPASLNKVVSREAGSTKELGEFIGERDAAPSSEVAVIKSTMTGILLDEVEKLGPLKRDVILSAFPLSEDSSMTPDEVKAHWQMPSPKFKRVQAEAVRELHESLSKRGFSFADFAETA